MLQGDLHASIRALDGYATFCQTLLAVMRWYPAVRAEVDRRIESFMEGQHRRNKYLVPALGEWLPLLVFSDRYSWRDVAHEYLRENFDRNAKVRKRR